MLDLPGCRRRSRCGWDRRRCRARPPDDWRSQCAAPASPAGSPYWVRPAPPPCDRLLCNRRRQVLSGNRSALGRPGKKSNSKRMRAAARGCGRAWRSGIGIRVCSAWLRADPAAGWTGAALRGNCSATKIPDAGRDSTIAFHQQLIVGPHHGVAGNRQLLGQPARRRQSRAWRNPGAADRLANLIGDLRRQRFRPRTDREERKSASACACRVTAPVDIFEQRLGQFVGPVAILIGFAAKSARFIALTGLAPSLRQQLDSSRRSRAAAAAQRGCKGCPKPRPAVQLLGRHAKIRAGRHRQPMDVMRICRRWLSARFSLRMRASPHSRTNGARPKLPLSHSNSRRDMKTARNRWLMPPQPHRRRCRIRRAHRPKPKIPSRSESCIRCRARWRSARPS